MEVNARDKLIKARAALVLDQPFFATIALRLELIEDKTAPTAYTDGRIIGYNPEFIDSISLEECKGLLCHEVLHIAAAHHIRRDARTPRRWNQAADHAINPLIAPIMALPRGGLMDPAYKDLSAEAIYSRLVEDQEDDGEDGDAGADPGQCGEVRDLKNGSGPGQTLTPQEIERAQADIKVLVSQAAQAARIMGQLPASLERFTDGIIKPKLNPYETLRRFITDTARNGVTWS
jgi:predicted metal-dependent peptidase